MQSSLRKHCRDWEVERVLEFEREFAMIRTDFAGLSKARSSLKTSARQIARLQVDMQERAGG
ncbi:MAG: conjugative transfer protein MobI(A/C) [Syntrophotalea sp.]|uniref:conjugative transfer protein MobI(A/C) n=1 Tax=Syntrophotalea sp. TaxID=2812029 RepID=UPI003D0E66D7